jgi:hypothetical protein
MTLQDVRHEWATELRDTARYVCKEEASSTLEPETACHLAVQDPVDMVIFLGYHWISVVCMIRSNMQGVCAQLVAFRSRSTFPNWIDYCIARSEQLIRKRQPNCQLLIGCDIGVLDEVIDASASKARDWMRCLDP